MKRFFAMVLVLVMICLPMVSMAEEFVFPETLDDFIPNALEVLSVAPPNTQPQIMMSEEKDVLLFVDVPEDEPSTVVQVAMFVFDGGHFTRCDFEKSTEDERAYVPVTPIDGEQLLKDIENGNYPMIEITCEYNQQMYSWLYLLPVERWEGHVYGDMDEYWFEISYQWKNENEPNYTVWCHGTDGYRAEYDPEGKLIK